MARLTPQEAAARWSQGVSQNVNRYAEGVQRVTQAPGQAAAAKADKYAAGVNASIQSGKWKNRTASVSLAAWQDATVNIGAARLGQSATAKVGKMEAAMSQLLPAVDAARNTVRAMPDTTLEQRVQRMVRFSQEMSKFQRR